MSAMADPKYADLPGIAYDQADVYETADLPESDQLRGYPEDENDSIDKLQINAAEAFSKFKGKRVVGKEVDFSDRISYKPRTGYNAAFGEWEVPGEGETETPIQKYQRLQSELKALCEETNGLKDLVDDEEEAKSTAELMAKVEQIGKQLDHMKLEQCLSTGLVDSVSNSQGTQFKHLVALIESFKTGGKVNEGVEASISQSTDAKVESTEPGILKYQMMYLPEKARMQEVARIAQLEQRLGRLENVIGVNNEKLAKFTQTFKSQGLIEVVQQLGAKASLLDANQIDAMESRLALLSHKMDSIAQKKSASVQDSERDQKVAEIYKAVKNTEDIAQVLPQTVNRMLSLNTVHQQAAQFSKSLKQLEDLQTQISAGLENNGARLKEVQEGFALNLETIKTNLVSLDERIEKLSK
ncbi:dynactin subunit 2 [Orussus abietinus]|uniref:dynactin subunit 2 n=1 Tax=Orussus abietinus TaxID=222816 RepID=UPI0006252E4E|nr:dynactin subunit 2 [Orussus abietinus]